MTDIAIEQASSFGWERYIGRRSCVIGMKTFGASAPLKELQRKSGFEPDQVVTPGKGLARQKSAQSRVRGGLTCLTTAIAPSSPWRKKPKKDEVFRWEQLFLLKGQILASTQSTRQGSNSSSLTVLRTISPSV